VSFIDRTNALHQQSLMKKMIMRKKAFDDENVVFKPKPARIQKYDISMLH